jgi:hypothetical protein
MARDHGCVCGPGKWRHHACAVEYVDCEQCSDERDVCGRGEPDGGGDECVYCDMEFGVCDSDGGSAAVVGLES